MKIIGRVILVKFAKAFYRNTSSFSKTKKNKVYKISLTHTELTSLLFSASFRHMEQSHNKRNSDIFFSKDSLIRNDQIRYDPAKQQPESIIHV